MHKQIASLIFGTVLLCMPVYAQHKGAYQIVGSKPHNKTYFTQGLEISNGLVYESSGLYGQSRVRKYRPSDDTALLETPIDKEYFAEGLTLLNDELFLLTWKKGKLFVFNPQDLTVKREHAYDTQGWGLANNGSHLIMSDGSNTLFFRDPETFELVREVEVHSNHHPVNRINELEFAQGYLWANIWQSPVIVKINPVNGALVSYYDLSEVVSKHTSGQDEKVLNGIAYDATEKAFWITGKLWNTRYLIEFSDN